jgi:hypothetical protein
MRRHKTIGLASSYPASTLVVALLCKFEYTGVQRKNLITMMLAASLLSVIGALVLTCDADGKL